MASLKCSLCGNGIHYHDEPNKIQLYAFTKSEWNRLIESPVPTCQYILDKGTDEFYVFWQCDKCGTLHMFKNYSIQMIKAYKPVESNDVIEISTPIIEGILFDDICWSEITEPTITWSEVTKLYPEIPFNYIRFNEEMLVIYSDPDYKNLVKVYKAL